MTFLAQQMPQFINWEAAEPTGEDIEIETHTERKRERHTARERKRERHRKRKKERAPRKRRRRVSGEENGREEVVRSYK